MRSSWALSVTLCIATAEGLAGQTAPPLYIDEGACPFECCHYGEWVSSSEVRLYESPDTLSPVVARLAVGDSVMAEYGEVWSAPTPFVFLIGEKGESGRQYAKGDTVWAVSYRGEGRFNVWKDGTVYSEDLGFSPYGGTGGTRCETCSHGSLLHEMRTTWWVRIRTAGGRIGWSDHPDSFDGKDACSEDPAAIQALSARLPMTFNRECGRELRRR